MRRSLLIVALLAGAAALPAAAARTQVSAQMLLMPQVAYQRQVEFTPRGPVVLDVVTAPRPDGTVYSLAPALSNGAVVGLEKLSDMEKDVTATTTSVGVNGDFFSANGVPTGILMRGGALDSAPASGRSSLGIDSSGALTVARVAFDGTWRGTSQRRQLDLGMAPVKGHTTLYTSAWGPTTPAESGVVEDVLGSFPAARPNSVLSGAVSQVVPQGGVPIPPGGAVLVARGAQAAYLSAEAPPGTTVEVRLTLTPNWSGMTNAIGGGPLLVQNGKAIFRANEAFGDPVLAARGARSAVGQLSDGRILLVSVEGGSSAYSVGMTNYELASALVRLGAVTAMGLGSGTPAAMAFDGSLLTKPTAATEPAISDALLYSYNGVYQAAPTLAVVSHGSDVANLQTFTYKLLRPSAVTVTLTAPNRTTRVLNQESEQPGMHNVQWTPAPSDPEGTWKATVAATDDRGLATAADRTFSVNDTLGSLATTPQVVQLNPRARGSLAATFDLAHPARVTATVETRSGIVISTLLDATLQPGPQKVLWNGRTWTGALAFTGAYQIRIVATNSIGTVQLVAQFTARRP